MTKLDGPTREYLQGYGSALADFNRLFDQPVRVYEALQQAGLDYHSLKDAGLETQDLGEIARCRDVWKQRPDLTSGNYTTVIGGEEAGFPRETSAPA